MDENLQLLKNLSELNGISGHEKPVTDFIIDYAKDFVDSATYDNLGSLILTKKGSRNEPTIMLSTHIDEVGFLVSNIDENGFLSIHPIGGWWSHVILAEQVIVTTTKGKSYKGVTCAEPPHGMSKERRDKTLNIQEIYVDMGVTDKKMIEELGIKIGDVVTPYTEFSVLNDGKTLLGKAWDNRVGVAVGLTALKDYILKMSNRHM